MKKALRREMLCIFAPLLVVSLISCSRIPFMRQRLLVEEKQQTERTEEAIAQSPILQEINRLCTEIPKPAGFTLVLKRRSFNDRNYLTYGYYSESPYPDVKGYYIDYFQKDGWGFQGEGGGANTNRLEFSKEKYTVSVTHVIADDGVNYLFVCEKKSD